MKRLHDNRVTSRSVPGVEVPVRDGDTNIEFGRLANVSMSGASIESRVALPVGAVRLLLFDLSNLGLEPLVLEATCRRCREEADRGRWDLGFEFTAVESRETSRLLGQLVLRHSI